VIGRAGDDRGVRRSGKMPVLYPRIPYRACIRSHMKGRPQDLSAGSKRVAAVKSHSMPISSELASWKKNSMRVGTALLVALGISMPVAAFAQLGPQTDQAYCNALSDTYVRHIGHSFDSPRRERDAGSLDAQVAVTQCHRGDTADAIPVLERELRSQGFNLPKRG
jgi:hypothetical protein